MEELERAAECDGVKPVALVHAVGGGREVKQRQRHPLSQLPRARDTEEGAAAGGWQQEGSSGTSLCSPAGLSETTPRAPSALIP